MMDVTTDGAKSASASANICRQKHHGADIPRCPPHEKPLCDQRVIQCPGQSPIIASASAIQNGMLRMATGVPIPVDVPT